MGGTGETFIFEGGPRDAQEGNRTAMTQKIGEAHPDQPPIVHPKRPLRALIAALFVLATHNGSLLRGE
jgi:hypothetical protein